MHTKEAKATTQNAETMGIEYSPSSAASKMAYERTLLKVSGLDGLKKTNKEILTKITDLDGDLSDADINSQNIYEALAML